MTEDELMSREHSELLLYVEKHNNAIVPRGCPKWKKTLVTAIRKDAKHITLTQLQESEGGVAGEGKVDTEWEAMVQLGSHRLTELARGSRENGLFNVKLSKTMVMPVEATPAVVCRVTESEMLTHSDTCKHRCEGCDRGFGNISALRKHMAVRTKAGGREFSWCPDPILRGKWKIGHICDKTETCRGVYYRVTREDRGSTGTRGVML